MTTKDKLRNDIKKLKEFLQKPSTPASAKDKIKAQIKKIEKELSAKKPTKTAATTVATTKVMLGKLQKFVTKNSRKYGSYSGTSESNLKKDAVRTALKIGRRVSEGKRSNQYGDKGSNKGNVYYEYRTNRLDVKQPKAKQTFPILKKGGKLDVGVYRIGKPKKISPNLYEQKIVEIFDNGDISTASDYGRNLSDFKSQKYPIITVEQFEEQYKLESGGYMADGGNTDGRFGYIAFYKGKRLEVYANTSYEAQLKAAKMFNAKKSYDVHVVLAEKDGQPVTHSTSSLAMGGVTEHGLMVGDHIMRISGSDKRMTVKNGTQFFHVNITTGERKKYMEDGGAINVLGDTAGAELQSVGGTMYSNADLTDHLTIENTGFFKHGGVLSKTHRRNS